MTPLEKAIRDDAALERARYLEERRRVEFWGGLVAWVIQKVWAVGWVMLIAYLVHRWAS